MITLSTLLISILLNITNTFLSIQKFIQYEPVFLVQNKLSRIQFYLLQFCSDMIDNYKIWEKEK